MLRVNYTCSGLRHTISGDAITVIRYLIDEALYNDSIEIVNVLIYSDLPQKD